MSSFRILLITLILLGTFGITNAQEDKLNIVATTTQASDLLNILAGDRVNITPLMGAGVDPHLYQPSESDIEAMNHADAIFYSGLHLEGQFGEVFEALGERDILIYAISDPVLHAGYVLEAVDAQGSGTGVHDPHYWFDPRNWQMTVQGMADELALLDPDGAEIYQTNADAYIQQLEALYEWGVEAMSQVPEEQRVLVTSHDAFNYFGDAFGWEVRGLQGISTQDEAGVGDVQSVAAFVVEHQLPVMFVESSVPPNTIEAVRDAVQSEGGEVGLGLRALYSDAMGNPGEFGGTYIGMISFNVITILQSYGYEIPAWPAVVEPVPPAELLTLTDVGA
jgi:manganese/zinc/iron transport system substrate-binding protein